MPIVSKMKLFCNRFYNLFTQKSRANPAANLRYPPRTKYQLVEVQSLEDLGIGLLYAAHVASESVLIQLLMGFDVP